MEGLTVSVDFSDFPRKHTCEGADISPRITIGGLDASSLAVMVFNPTRSEERRVGKEC